MIKVRLDLIEEPGVCSLAYKRGKFRQEVIVGNQTTLAVPYIIIPLKSGEYQIEVQGTVRDILIKDGILKKLRVVV